MTRIAILTTTLGLTLLAAGAQAQGMYGEVGYTGLQYKRPGLKVHPGMVRGVVGFEFSPHASVEGMLGLNGRSDSASGTNVKVNNLLGVFGKVQAPLTNELKIYGRLGVARNSLKFNGVSTSETGLAYGAGVTYDLSKTTYLNADYTSYYDRRNQKLDGYTVGVGFRF